MVLWCHLASTFCTFLHQRALSEEDLTLPGITPKTRKCGQKECMISAKSFSSQSTTIPPIMSDLGTRWNKSMILLHPCATLGILGDAIFLDFLGTDERAQRAQATARLLLHPSPFPSSQRHCDLRMHGSRLLPTWDRWSLEWALYHDKMYN